MGNVVERHKPLNIQYDGNEDVIYIEGIAYSGHIFRSAALTEIGTWFRIEDNKNGCLSIHTPSPDAHKIFDAITARL